jgi:hypothetical protein
MKGFSGLEENGLAADNLFMKKIHKVGFELLRV